MDPAKIIVVPVAFIGEAPLQALAVDEEGLRKMLGYDSKAPAAARQASWRFRRTFKIRTLPGRVYSIAEIRKAVNEVSTRKKTASW